MRWKRILKWSALVLLLGVIAATEFAYWRSTSECDENTGPAAHPMKAIMQCDYGSPDLLRLEEVERPDPGENRVLIRVRAASLNFIDAAIMRGPLPLRFVAGLRKPKKTFLGMDVAGVVESVGRKVTQFKPGDEVFGLARHSLAEFVTAPERALVLKPGNVTFEQAASAGLAALTALQGLRAGNVATGKTILINGASGGVGTFAVQMAKALGAEVTAVCSATKVDLVRSLGADRVIDYTKEDFTTGGQRYDVIYDNVGNHSRAERSRILTPDGICVLAGIGGAGMRDGQWSRIAGNYGAFFASRFSRQKFQTFGTRTKPGDLAVLRDWLATGKVKPVIERTYSLAETAAGLRYLEEGHARGKIVITIP